VDLFLYLKASNDRLIAYPPHEQFVVKGFHLGTKYKSRFAHIFIKAQKQNNASPFCTRHQTGPTVTSFLHYKSVVAEI